MYVPMYLYIHGMSYLRTMSLGHFLENVLINVEVASLGQAIHQQTIKITSVPGSRTLILVKKVGN